MTCPNCETLRAENRDLRRAIAQERGRSTINTLSQRLKLSSQPARVVASLYAANGRVQSIEFLLDMVIGNGDETPRSKKHLDQVICKARVAVGKAGIVNHRGLGYSLTQIGRLVVEEALEGKK